jgi:hypothetical protein
MCAIKLMQRIIFFLVLFSHVAESKQLLQNTLFVYGEDKKEELSISGEDIKVGAITINNVFPLPNYSLSTDEDDIKQLTDKEILRFPIWSKKKCVGWQNRSPIKISAKIGGAKNKQSAIKGVLRIHTAKNINASVKVLKRVDVYSRVNSNQYIHVGNYQGFEHNWGDRQNHWVNVNVNKLGNELDIVIHGNGPFIFIDEIEWIPSNDSSISDQGIHLLQSQIIKDSTDKLKLALMDKARFNQKNEKFNNSSKLRVWVDDPWGDLTWKPSVKKINRASKEVRIMGMNNEKESAVLGVFNPESGDEFNVTISSNQKINNEAIELGVVDNILSASGKLIFDPIIPLKKGEPFNVKINEVGYIWLSVDLSKLQEKHYEANILVSSKDSSSQYSIPLIIDVVDKELNIEGPSAINWSYTSDLPIWNNPEQAMEDLIEHGINVFVVPPKHIPQPNIEGKWDIDAARKLKKDLDLFKGKGQILLFVAWGAGSRPRPEWMFTRTGLNEEKKFEILKSWLFQLNHYMKKRGFSYNDWAIYPVDEVHGKKLDFLMKVVPWIKKANPKIRIYANPSLSRTGYATHCQLKELEPLIDIWQPSSAYATTKGKRFFSKLTAPWWVYDNPKSPVKQSSPFEDYRKLSWEAWDMGSSGVGFWAYSDTKGSSAWDDLDGTKPDWAVVYEGESKLVSSRRWEAFREGIEDYRLLTTAENMNCYPSSLGKRIRESLSRGTLDSLSINLFRQQILHCISEN